MDGTDGAVVAGGSRWSRGDAYERYLGRWSAMLAPRFVDWLGSDRGAAWVDVGCGSGALTAAILAADETPGARVCGVDPSAGFLGTARRRIGDRRVHFTVADAARLPFDAARFDLAVSGLVLNFLDDPVACLREMARVCRSGGTVGGYVWDYTGQMWLLRHFWEAVFALRPDARDLDEVRRFAACQPDPLRALFTAAGLAQVEVTAIDDVATFRDFDDYWDPFLAGQGAAPSFVVSFPRRRAPRSPRRCGTDYPPRATARSAWACGCGRSEASSLHKGPLVTLSMAPCVWPPPRPIPSGSTPPPRPTGSWP